MAEFDDDSAEPDALRGLTEEQAERLTNVLEKYLDDLESGRAPDGQLLLQQHADLRGPLTSYLSKLSDLHNFAAGFSPHLAGIPQADPSSSAASPLFPDGSFSGQLSSPLASPETRGVPETGQALRPAARSGNQQTAAADGSRGPDSGLEGVVSPRRLGDFQLLRVIGRGGMGVVYEAEQISLKRRVALKLLPLISVLDARQIKRFQNEAQAAAGLQHPNIVPVYAVGDDQGVHYYAMQLIEGEALDAIIGTLRLTATAAVLVHEATLEADNAPSQPIGQVDSTGSERSRLGDWREPTDWRRVLKLGAQAASALAAAHNDGIIHRDIKPSNLLLDHHDKLWITDFGLARRSNDHSLTASGDLLGTLRYMSPEQATGQTALVDGRSDLYSLAVTLYELLTLQPAVIGDNSPALLRAIEQQTPVALRTLRPDIPKDVSTVIETAMAKNREDRYPTAQQFADDVARVLAGQPPLAKPTTWLVSMAKWAMRHQRIVAAAAATVLIVCLGLATSTWMIARQARLARDSGQRAQRVWVGLRDSLERSYAETSQALLQVPGAEGVRQQLLSDMLDSYLKFIEDFGDDQAARADIALARLRLGNLYQELGDLNLALANLRQAYSMTGRLVAAHPSDAELKRQQANCAGQLGSVLVAVGDLSAAEAKLREAVQQQQQLAVEQPDNLSIAIELARSQNNLALLLADTGQPEAARALLESTESRLATWAGREPRNWALGEILSTTYNNLARLDSADHPELAAQWYQRALSSDHAQTAAVLGNASPGIPPSAPRALMLNNLGKVRARLGQLEQAIEDYRQAIEIQRRLVELSPTNRNYPRDLSLYLNNLGLAQTRHQDWKAAQQSFEESLRLQEQLLAEDPDEVRLQHQLGGTWNNLATLRQAFSDRPAVDEAFEKALEYQRLAVAAAPGVASYREFLDNHLQNYALWLGKTGRDELACQQAAQRRELWRSDSQRLVNLARQLTDTALSSANPKTARLYADAAWETLRLASNQGEGIELLLSQEPFSSLTKLRAP